MLQKRSSIFETNSSSTHCITIANNSDDDFKKNLGNKLEFKFGQFGWEFNRYDTVEERASYLATGILYNSMCDEYFPKIKEILSRYNVEAIFPEICKEVSNYTETGYCDAPFDVEWYDYCYYVDHGSKLKDWIKEVCNDEMLLMNYLYSEERFVSTGNDSQLPLS